MAEYEHQFKVIDEAQKILVVREMMPKDIKREFLTGPRKFDEVMGKLEIIINEMMADDGPTPMELGNNSGGMTRRLGHEHWPSLGKGIRPAREQARRDRMGQDHGIVEDELLKGRVARKMTKVRKEARRAPRAASLMGTVTRTRGAIGAKGKARALRRARAHRSELSILFG